MSKWYLEYLELGVHQQLRVTYEKGITRELDCMKRAARDQQGIVLCKCGGQRAGQLLPSSPCMFSTTA